MKSGGVGAKDEGRLAFPSRRYAGSLDRSHESYVVDFQCGAHLQSGGDLREIMQRILRAVDGDAFADERERGGFKGLTDSP